MIVSLFYVSLLIVQIVLLINFVRNKENMWLYLFSLEISSIISSGLVIGYSVFRIHYFEWTSVVLIILSVLAILVYMLMIMISFVIKITKNKEIEVNNVGINATKKYTSKIIFKVLGVVLLCLLLFVSAETKLYDIGVDEQEIIRQENLITARKSVLDYLKNKYGNGNFSIVDVKNSEGKNSFDYEPYIYEMTLSSNYMNENFNVIIASETNHIQQDDFLDKYYYEKLGISNLKEYLIDYRIEELNNSISEKFDATISFSDQSIYDYGKEYYGKIPDLSVLAKDVKLYDPKIDINADITNEDDLLSYLVDLTKFYIKEFDKTNIGYSYESEYFRYKYDYTKFGIYDYTDQYEGYGGYVYAGEYKWSDEKEHYVREKEDEIVRINVMGKVITYALEDIIE